MRRQFPLIVFLAVISLISGYLIHKMSWFARIGINWFYKEYTIFKSWGKTTLLEFAIFMLLVGLHSLIQKKANPRLAMQLHLTGIVASLIGLYFTYADFRNDFSHRIAGERFHIGFYLFWLGWVVICLRFMFMGKNNRVTARNEAV